MPVESNTHGRPEIVRFISRADTHPRATKRRKARRNDAQLSVTGDGSFRMVVARRARSVESTGWKYSHGPPRASRRRPTFFDGPLHRSTPQKAVRRPEVHDFRRPVLGEGVQVDVGQV